MLSGNPWRWVLVVVAVISFSVVFFSAFPVFFGLQGREARLSLLKKEGDRYAIEEFYRDEDHSTAQAACWVAFAVASVGLAVTSGARREDSGHGG